MEFKPMTSTAVLTSFQWCFIAQLAKQCTSMVEVMGLNPVGDFFLGFIYKWFKSYFITQAKISSSYVYLLVNSTAYS